MNIFELGWKLFNHRDDIQKVIQLIQPTLQAYNNNPNVVKTLENAINQTKPIIDQYSKVENQVVPLITMLVNDLFPPNQTNLPQPPAGGYTVNWLQGALNKLGAHPKLNIDGDYGPLTKTAVEDYQKKLVARHELNWLPSDIDGWAGLKTCSKIYNDLIKLP